MTSMRQKRPANTHHILFNLGSSSFYITCSSNAFLSSRCTHKVVGVVRFLVNMDPIGIALKYK